MSRLSIESSTDDCYSASELTREQREGKNGEKEVKERRPRDGDITVPFK